MTAEYALHVSHLAAHSSQEYKPQEWLLNLFDMTRGEAKGAAETSITDEAFTAVVMTIGMGESILSFASLET